MERAERLFYETIEKNLEPVTKKDAALLSEVGIHAWPVFKFTKGKHTVAVYAYEDERKNRYVVRFTAEKTPLRNEKKAALLIKHGFCVAEFFRNVDISGKNLRAKNRFITYCDITRWVGYDFSIRIAAAVMLLEKGDYNSKKDIVAKANDILLDVGAAAGKVFGALYKESMLYTDFRARNLAGLGKEACFFDLHGESVMQIKNKTETLRQGDNFFKDIKTVIEPLAKDPHRRKYIVTLLKNAFLAAVKGSGSDVALITDVEQNISKWG